jgi:hypothetical protein
MSETWTFLGRSEAIRNVTTIWSNIVATLLNYGITMLLVLAGIHLSFLVNHNGITSLVGARFEINTATTSAQWEFNWLTFLVHNP